jgi:hypothetical protein
MENDGIQNLLAHIYQGKKMMNRRLNSLAQRVCVRYKSHIFYYFLFVYHIETKEV